MKSLHLAFALSSFALAACGTASLPPAQAPDAPAPVLAGPVEPPAPAATGFLLRVPRRRGEPAHINARVAVAGDGAIYLAHDLEGGGSTLLRLRSDGSTEWSHPLPATTTALGVDRDGNALVGLAGDRTLVIRIAADGTERARFDNAASAEWNQIYSFTTDDTGRVFASGTVWGALDLDGRRMRGGYFTGFVAALDGDHVAWLTPIAAPESGARSLAVTAAGEVVVSGFFKTRLRIGPTPLTIDRDSYRGYVAVLDREGRVARAFVAPMNDAETMTLLPDGVVALAGPDATRRRGELVGVRLADGDVVFRGDLPNEHVTFANDGARAFLLVAETETISMQAVTPNGPTGDRVAIASRSARFAAPLSAAFAPDGLLVAGSLFDRRFDAVGLYPFLARVEAGVGNVDIDDLPAIGGLPPSRCEQRAGDPNASWLDLMFLTQFQIASELVPCPGKLYPERVDVEVAADGRILSAEVVGESMDPAGEECVEAILRQERICPGTPILLHGQTLTLNALD